MYWYEFLDYITTESCHQSPCHLPIWQAPSPPNSPWPPPSPPGPWLILFATYTYDQYCRCSFFLYQSLNHPPCRTKPSCTKLMDSTIHLQANVHCASMDMDRNSASNQNLAKSICCLRIQIKKVGLNNMVIGHT